MSLFAKWLGSMARGDDTSARVGGWRRVVIPLAAAAVCHAGASAASLLNIHLHSFKRRLFICPLRTTILYLPVDRVPRIAAPSKGVGPEVPSERVFEPRNGTCMSCFRYS